MIFEEITWQKMLQNTKQNKTHQWLSLDVISPQILKFIDNATHRLIMEANGQNINGVWGFNHSARRVYSVRGRGGGGATPAVIRGFPYPVTLHTYLPGPLSIPLLLGKGLYDRRVHTLCDLSNFLQWLYHCICRFLVSHFLRVLVLQHDCYMQIPHLWFPFFNLWMFKWLVLYFFCKYRATCHISFVWYAKVLKEKTAFCQRQSFCWQIKQDAWEF